MHGVEGPSTDRPQDNIFARHRLCRDLGISHFEWLVNLEALVGKGEFQFIGLPIRFKGGSGSPVLARCHACETARGGTDRGTGSADAAVVHGQVFPSSGPSMIKARAFSHGRRMPALRPTTQSCCRVGLA